MTDAKTPAETTLYDRLEALKSTMPPGQVARLGSIPKKYFKGQIRAPLGEATSRSSIKAYCQQCVGFSDLPSSVRECSARACPLWALRPYRLKPEAAG
jgi:hypothetical protein